MSLTSRKKRPLDRSQIGFRDSKIFVIATEGTLTEPQYFHFFRNTRVQLEILPTKDGHSSPTAVVERLMNYKKNYQLGPEDRLFVVIDLDCWKPQQLSAVAQTCQNEGFILTVSNPCFELWLYLHHSDNICNLVRCADVETQLKIALTGYNKSNLKKSDFRKDVVQLAIARAKALDKPADRWPQSIGSRVYRVMEELLPFSE